MHPLLAKMEHAFAYRLNIFAAYDYLLLPNSFLFFHIKISIFTLPMRNGSGTEFPENSVELKVFQYFVTRSRHLPK